MEIEKVTIKEFLNSLVTTIFRIKRNNQWYEMRVAEGFSDKPFVDTEGSLFGVKNAKINFYVFNAGTNEVAEWAPSFLKDFYEELNLARLPEDEVMVSYELFYSEAFIDNLLTYRDFLIFNQNGVKIKKKKNDPYLAY